MVTFLGLKQIWVWVKKLPILFFVASFISFEPKLKMAAVVASISSTSLFSPNALARPKTLNPQPHKPSNSNSKRKKPLRNPSTPPPRTNNRETHLHPHSVEGPTSTHTPTQLLPTLRLQSGEFSPFSSLL